MARGVTAGMEVRELWRYPVKSWIAADDGEVAPPHGSVIAPATPSG
jgi:hypothetical protein